MWISAAPAPDYMKLLTDSISEVRQAKVEADLNAEKIGITLMTRESSTAKWEFASWQGDRPFYPASVIKVFWLAFAAHQLSLGKIRLTAEMQRASEDMIRASSNDATGYIVNLTTGALPGPELAPEEFEKWFQQRSAANLWFKSLGFKNVNCLNRTYNEAPYGVEKQGVGENSERRNMLSSFSTAELLRRIVFDATIDPERDEWMRGLLHRGTPADDPNTDNQAKLFIGGVLPKGTQMWSKAGWTSTTRHDACAFELPNKRQVVLVIFTEYGANSKLVPTLAGSILRRLEP